MTFGMSDRSGGAVGPPADGSAGKARPAGLRDDVWRYLLTGLVLVAAWTALTVPWWHDGLVIPYDSVNHFYAMLRGVARHLAAGDWPAWLPETYGGRPTVADPQSLVLTPSLLALAWIDPTPSVHHMDLVVHVHLLVGAFFVAVWGLRRGAHPLAVLIGALVFAFGGSAMARSQHTLLVLSYAWLPLAMLSVEWLLERPNAWRAVLTALVLAVLTLNRDHVAMLGHFVVAGTAIAWLAGRDQPWRRLRRTLPWIALSVAIWLAIIVVPVLASLSYVAGSNRPGFEAELVGRVLSLPFASLLTLVFPNLFSTLDNADLYWGPGAREWPGFWFDSAIVQIAIGAVPAAILLWLGLARALVAAPGARLGAIIALVALAYALGTRTPFFAIAFSALPGLDLYQRPADATFIVNLGLSLALVGIVDAYLVSGLRRRPRWRLGLEAAAWLVLVSGALALAASRQRLAGALDDVLLPSFLVAVTVGALLWGAGRSGRTRASVVAGLLALTVADLALHTAGTPMNARPVEEVVPLDDPAADPLARWLMERMPEIEETEGAMRVELLGLGGAWQNASLAIGVDNVLGYNPLRDERYEIATGARQNSGGMDNRSFGTLMTGYAAPFADLLGVRYIVLGEPMEAIDPGSVGAFPEPRRIGHAYVYENRDAVPRLVLVPAGAARPHDPDAILASGDLPPFDGRTEALVEGVAPAADAPAAPFGGTLSVVERRPDGVRLRVSTDRPAFVVFHEMADPGWAAFVDGERRPILRANVLFQAVAVEPGTSQVAFEYSTLRAALSVLRR